MCWKSLTLRASPFRHRKKTLACVQCDVPSSRTDATTTPFNVTELDIAVSRVSHTANIQQSSVAVQVNEVVQVIKCIIRVMSGYFGKLLFSK